MASSAMNYEGGLPHGRPSTSHQRCHQKPRFIEEYQMRPERCRFFYQDARALDPVADLLFIAFSRSSLRPLRAPAQGMQQPSHMVNVVAHAELATD